MSLSIRDTSKVADERTWPTCELEAGDAGQRAVHIQRANLERCMLPADGEIGAQLNAVSCAAITTHVVCAGSQEERCVLICSRPRLPIRSEDPHAGFSRLSIDYACGTASHHLLL